MGIAIQAFGWLSAIGGIVIGVLLYYNKQTSAVWTTFATVVFAGLAFCLNWQKLILSKKNQNNKKSTYSVWGAFAIIVSLTLVCCIYWQQSIWLKRPQDNKKIIQKEITLLTLYEEDFNDLLRVNEDRIITSQDGSTVTINSKVYFDFETQTKFVGFYIPSTPITFDICVNLSDFYKTALEMGNGNLAEWSQPGLQPVNNRELQFSRRIFIYHQYPLFATQKRKLFSLYESRGLSLQFRGQDYVFKKNSKNHTNKGINSDS